MWVVGYVNIQFAVVIKLSSNLQKFMKYCYMCILIIVFNFKTKFEQFFVFSAEFIVKHMKSNYLKFLKFWKSVLDSCFCSQIALTMFATIRNMFVIVLCCFDMFWLLCHNWHIVFLLDPFCVLTQPTTTKIVTYNFLQNLQNNIQHKTYDSQSNKNKMQSFYVTVSIWIIC